MADQTIPYNRGKPFGELTAEMTDHLVQARTLANRIKAKADEIMSGGGSGTLLEDANYFGVGAGKGPAFFTALTTLKDNLNGIGANGVAQDKLADLDLGG